MSFNSKTHITIIGSGTMACAILDGLALCTSNFANQKQYSISVLVRGSEKIRTIQERYPHILVDSSTSSPHLPPRPEIAESQTHVILICTKTESMPEICAHICLTYDAALRPCVLPTIVTVCPGITASTLSSWLSPQGIGKPFPIVRTMPNTVIAIGQGATAMFAAPHTEVPELELVVTLFREFSPCVEVLEDENLLDVAAAVSGSGPAYIFEFYQALVAAGVRNGLPESVTRSLLVQTAVGSSMMARSHREVPLSAMVDAVCVPGGSTEKGIRRLTKWGLRKQVIEAVEATLQANHDMSGLK